MIKKINPCEECIVDAICKEQCELLKDYLYELLVIKCKVNLKYQIDLGFHLRYSINGHLGMRDDVEYLVRIKYRSRRIHSIIRYPPIYSKTTGRLMVLYSPEKGVKLYEISKSM